MSDINRSGNLESPPAHPAMTQSNQDSLLEKASIEDTRPPFGVGKSTRSRAARRSLSGAPLTYLFETKFQHFKAFQKTQKDARGLNFLLGPTSGALYRSSMPVTPIATPIASHGLKFTEQSLHNRILQQSQLPRRTLLNSYNQPDIAEGPESHVTFDSRVPISETNKSRIDTHLTAVKTEIDDRKTKSKGSNKDQIGDSVGQKKDSPPPSSSTGTRSRRQNRRNR